MHHDKKHESTEGHHDRKHESAERQGDSPSDTEGLVGETAASEPLTTKPRVQPSEADERDNQDRGAQHTNSGKISSPSFGSAVSGGALADPGPERS